MGVSDENILKWYMKGFKDELKGSSTVESDNLIENKAYTLGANHAVLGIDISNYNERDEKEIIKEVKT